MPLLAIRSAAVVDSVALLCTLYKPSKTMDREFQIASKQHKIWLLTAFVLSILTCEMSAAAQSQPNTVMDSAEWLRSLGGRFACNAAGAITSVDLRHAWLIDADLKKLSDLSELESIDLASTKVTDEGLMQLRKLEKVRSLNLHYAEYVTDTGIAHLKHWTNLEHLNVRGTKVTSMLFEHLTNMVLLRSLDIGHSRVNDDNFERLAELPNMERLSFGGNKMSGSALPLLKLLPKLCELSIGGQQRTDSGLWSVSVGDFNIGNIAELASLKMLDLSDTTITDSGVAQLARLDKLETLNLNRTKLTGKGVATLAGIRSLRHLKLAQSGSIDDSVLLALETFTNLEVLELQESRISFDGLMRYSPSRRLRKLFIGGTPLTAEQVEAVRLRLPGCYISWWPTPKMTAE